MSCEPKKVLKQYGCAKLGLNSIILLENDNILSNIARYLLILSNIVQYCRISVQRPAYIKVKVQTKLFRNIEVLP